MKKLLYLLLLIPIYIGAQTVQYGNILGPNQAQQSLGSGANNTSFSNVTITGNSSFNIVTNLGANITTNVITLSNSFVASVANQGFSPAIDFASVGWQTATGGSDQSMEFRTYSLAIQGTANISGAYRIDSQRNGSGWNTNIFQLDYLGNLTLGAGISTSANITGSITSPFFTNLTGVNIIVGYNCTAVSITNFNGSGVAWRTNIALTGEFSTMLQPNGVIRASGTITGNYTAF